MIGQIRFNCGVSTDFNPNLIGTPMERNSTGIQKPKLIFLHGALGAKTQFEPLVKALSNKFEIWTMDFEGHGKSNPSGRPYRISSFAENLEQFIEDNGLQSANVFGYSMGGYVALYLAAKREGLIGKIFTLATKLKWDPATSKKEVRMHDPQVIQDKVPHYAKMLEARHSGPGWKTVLEQTAEMMLDLGEHPLLSEAEFANISIKVRLGIGDRDKMVSLEETQFAFQNLKNGELMVFPKTPHPIEKINISLISSAIEDFFQA